MNRLLLGLSAALLAAASGASPASAATSPPSTTAPAATVDIDDCNVKTSRNAGGFTWAYCPIVVQSSTNRTVRVRYRVNLETYIPEPGASFRPGTGTLGFSGGGDQLLNVKFAFKGLTPAQVVRRLKVTLSQPTGATIVDATATANPTAGTS